MKPAIAFISVALAASAAHAATIPVSFNGTVDDGSYANPPVNTTFRPGQPISGSFVFNTVTDTFTSFRIGGYVAPAAAVTMFSPPLAATGSAFLTDEATSVATGRPTAEFSIDFYYEVALPSTTNIVSFIENPGAFSTDLAGQPSTFSVFLANADGSDTTVSGLLTSYVVPEPGAMMLMAPALAGLAFARRRVG